MPPMLAAYREILGLPRPVWILFWSGLINRAGNMVLPFLALYANKVLGLSAADSTSLVAVWGVGSLFASLFSGWLADRVGAARVLTASLIGSAALMVVISFVSQPVLFAFVVFVLAVVTDSFRPALLSLASEYGPRDKQRQTFALVRLSFNLGMGLGPAIGGVLFLYWPQLLFWSNACALLGAAAVLVWAAGRGHFPHKKLEPQHRLSLFRSLRIAYTDSRLVWVLLAIEFPLMVLFQHESTMPLILIQDLKMTEAEYGMVFTVNTMLIVFLEIWLVSKTARYSAARVMALGSIFTGIGFGLLGLATNNLQLQLTTAIWTLGEMLTFPMAVSYVSEISSPQTRGSYMAAYGLLFGLTLITAPLFGTFFWQGSGLTAFCVACGVMGLLGAGMMLGGERRFMSARGRSSAAGPVPDIH
ncbi:MFS transporter [bacterium]|nr:MFS transporter [bacterium]